MIVGILVRENKNRNSSLDSHLKIQFDQIWRVSNSLENLVNGIKNKALPHHLLLLVINNHCVPMVVAILMQDSDKDILVSIPV